MNLLHDIHLAFATRSASPKIGFVPFGLLVRVVHMCAAAFFSERKEGWLNIACALRTSATRPLFDNFEIQRIPKFH